MAVYAQLTYLNYYQQFPDQFGGEIDAADVYISLFDSVTNQPVSGNGIQCTYSEDDNGTVNNHTVTILFPTYLIQANSVLSESHYDSNGNQLSSAYKSYAIVSLSGGQSQSCDIVVTASKTDETAQGANDGTINAVAVSSFTGIQYSLDGVTYQNSGIFTGLMPGTYTVYAKDSHPCIATTQVIIVAYLNPVSNFASALPVVTLPSGNVSKWNAAFNPIILKYQRRDTLVSSVTGSGQNAVVTLSRQLSSAEINVALNDNCYLSTQSYDYYGPATSHAVVSGVSVLTINGIYSVNDTVGFLNIPNSRTNYKIVTEITVGTTKITCTHSPNKKGFTRGDISGFLKTIVSATESNNYTVVNFLDKNLSQAFSIRYQEVWDNVTSQWFTAPYNLYATFSAMQIGEAYGGNMAQYVTFPTTDLAKWLTEFENPVLNIGLPFDLSFIYSENLIGQQLYAQITPNVGGATGSYLLNSAGGYILNNTGGKIAIASNQLPPIPLTSNIGINRFNIPQNFSALATSAVINIYYVYNGNNVYIMKPITIKIAQPRTDTYTYLKWINHLGGADYFRFGFNQSYSGDISNVQSVKRFVDDYATADTVEDLTQKTAIDKINVGCDLLTPDQVKALRWLRKSIKAQMLIDPNNITWNTVTVEDGTYDAFQTKRNSGAVNFTIYLPSTNIQFQ